MSNIADASIDFAPPPEEVFSKSVDGKPIRITDPKTNRTSALVKLENFIDTYLYVVKYMDPKVINYLNQAGEGVVFYYYVQDKKTGIKTSNNGCITFEFIYLNIFP